MNATNNPANPTIDAYVWVNDDGDATYYCPTCVNACEDVHEDDGSISPALQPVYSDEWANDPSDPRITCGDCGRIIRAGRRITLSDRMTDWLGDHE